MKLSVLVDNNTFIDQYFVGEPAVSYYIEVDDKRILFDTGYSDILLDNASKLNIDLNNLTHIILSHGHNDHTNGLKFLINNRDISKTRLICHPECFLPKYVEDEYIGAPYTEKEISKIFIYQPVSEVTKISESLLFLGEIPRINNFEAMNPIGIEIKDNCKQDDYVLDDTALVYKNFEGIFIITGCSHSGICNIVEYAKKICNEEHILGIVGGFHMLDNQLQINKTIDYLKKNKIDIIYPCHCVSLLAKARMINELPVNEVGVGMTISI